jgi:hypothetical protein
LGIGRSAHSFALSLTDSRRTQEEPGTNFKVLIGVKRRLN